MEKHINKNRNIFINKGGSNGAVYGLGFLGAAVYYIMHATGFWMGAWGVIKAIFWPGFLVYEIFVRLGM